MADRPSQPTFGQLRKLTQIIESTPSWRMQEILSSGILHDLFEPAASLRRRDEVRAALDLDGPAYGDMRITINYAKQFSARLVDANLTRTPFTTEGVPEPFTIVGQGIHEFQLRLFEFGTCTSSYAARNLIGWGHNGWVPGRIEDLLELAGEDHIQNLEPGHYVALSSVAIIDGKEHVPVMHIGAQSRSVWLETEPLSRGRDEWVPETKFIGIRPAAEPRFS